VEGQQIMDTARPGFVRWMALEKWRELVDLRESAGLDAAGSAAEAGRFAERGPYRALWETRWRERVMPLAGSAEPPALFAAIEQVVADALDAEEAARAAGGDRPLDEDPAFRAFLGSTFARLARAGEDTLESGR
jgi:hypothetical protein